MGSSVSTDIVRWLTIAEIVDAIAETRWPLTAGWIMGLRRRHGGRVSLIRVVFGIWFICSLNLLNVCGCDFWIICWIDKYMYSRRHCQAFMSHVSMMMSEISRISNVVEKISINYNDFFYMAYLLGPCEPSRPIDSSPSLPSHFPRPKGSSTLIGWLIPIPPQIIKLGAQLHIIWFLFIFLK